MSTFSWTLLEILVVLLESCFKSVDGSLAVTLLSTQRSWPCQPYTKLRRTAATHSKRVKKIPTIMVMFTRSSFLWGLVFIFTFWQPQSNMWFLAVRLKITSFMSKSLNQAKKELNKILICHSLSSKIKSSDSKWKKWKKSLASKMTLYSNKWMKDNWLQQRIQMKLRPCNFKLMSTIKKKIKKKAPLFKNRTFSVLNQTSPRSEWHHLSLKMNFTCHQ
jgi:hypothetical protein